MRNNREDCIVKVLTACDGYSHIYIWTSEASDLAGNCHYSDKHTCVGISSWWFSLICSGSSVNSVLLVVFPSHHLLCLR